MTPAGSAGTDGPRNAPPGRHRAEDDPTRWVKPLAWITALVGMAGATGGTIASAQDTGRAISVQPSDVKPRPHITAATTVAGPLVVPSIGAEGAWTPPETTTPVTTRARVQRTVVPAPRSVPGIATSSPLPSSRAESVPVEVAPVPEAPGAIQGEQAEPEMQSTQNEASGSPSPEPTPNADPTPADTPLPVDPTPSEEAPVTPTEMPLPTVVEVTVP